MDFDGDFLEEKKCSHKKIFIECIIILYVINFNVFI
jgi:hypothetical protein